MLLPQRRIESRYLPFVVHRAISAEKNLVSVVCLNAEAGQQGSKVSGKSQKRPVSATERVTDHVFFFLIVKER